MRALLATLSLTILLSSCGAEPTKGAVAPCPSAPSAAAATQPPAVQPQAVPAAVASDPPRDAEHPAAMIPFALPTNGEKINALLYTAAGAGPHPTVLLLHGFPGNEQNLDLAQAIRRDGWNVLTLHYRGAWGSPGEYTFTHCLEDARAALEWLKAPSGEAAPHIDAQRIVVVGHSFGGFATSFVAAHDARVAGAAIISGAPLGLLARLPRDKLVALFDNELQSSSGMRPLGDVTAAAIVDEMVRNADAWDPANYAGDLATRPVLVVTSDDGLAEAGEAIASTAGKRGAHVSRVHLATDHSYSDRRVELTTIVIRWLESLPARPSQ
jgi:pimeloyl-ACP methyl ester carboxylesterase